MSCVPCPHPAFFQPGNDNLLEILRRKWWKYILLGLADVEANYLIVRAYQYTTLTSVQVRGSLDISGFMLPRGERVLLYVHLVLLEACAFEEARNTGG